MTLATTGWIFTACVVLHNAEEALWLPAWARRHAPIAAARRAWTAPGLRRSLPFVSALLVVLTASAYLHGGFVRYLMAGFVLTMMLNAIVPHLALSLYTKSYMPGTTSGVLLLLPLGWMYLREAIAERAVHAHTLAWTGPLTMLGFLALIPIVMRLVRTSDRARRRFVSPTQVELEWAPLSSLMNTGCPTSRL